MSLRTRLTVIVAVIVAVAVVGGAYAAHLSTQHALQDETDKFLHDRAAGFVRQPPGDLGGDFGGAPNDDDDHGGRYFEFDAIQQTIDRNGTVTNSLPNQSTLPIDAEDREIASSPGESHYRDVTVDGESYRMITASLRNGGAVMIALAGIAFAALAAWLVMRRATRPIEELTDTAEHIADTQDLATPIPVRGDDEVGRLAASFNTMLIALDTSREQQQRLVVDASHELRTPLTAVRTNIDFLGHATTLDAEERAQLIAETRLELDELTNLVSEMVELATDVRSEESVEPIVLADVVNDVATRFRRRTGTEIIVVVVDGGGTEAGEIDGRRAMLDRAVANLVDNALKFSPPGGAVDVTVRGTTVEVADRGPGIDAEDRARVFDRFYRATSARTLPGSGLGLSIVSQIATLHGGTVTLDAREGGGTVARLSL
jgi:two-component system sensor histidine kinase MprB